MKTLIAVAALGLLFAAPAQAHGVTFGVIPSDGGLPNNPISSTIGGQFSVTVAPGVSNMHTFTFANAVGGVASTITHIYVDTGAGPAILMDVAWSNDTLGVDMANTGGVGPNNLPSQNNASPPFTTDERVKREAAGGVGNGIDPGEAGSWTLKFDAPFNAHAALHSGALRFGLHVQRIAPLGGSDSFVSGEPGDPMPEPSSLVLAVAGLAGVFVLRRRF